jgi:hypothetical protein
VDIDGEELVDALDDGVLAGIDEGPPEMAQLPMAMTHLGSGIWS